jgi:hypothetical protein
VIACSKFKQQRPEKRGQRNFNVGSVEWQVLLSTLISDDICSLNQLHVGRRHQRMTELMQTTKDKQRAMQFFTLSTLALVANEGRRGAILPARISARQKSDGPQDEKLIEDDQWDVPRVQQASHCRNPGGRQRVKP